MGNIEKTLPKIWAKKKEGANQFYWLPLTVHLQDTIGVMRFLWHHWVSEGQKHIIINNLVLSSPKWDAETIAVNLACFLAGVHDVGKCTPMFQTQKGYSNSLDLDIAIWEQLEIAGLAGIKHIRFSENARRDSHHTIMGEYLLRDFGVKQDIASIIGAHHGKPTDADDKVEELRGYPERFYQEAKGIIYEQWHNMQDKIIRDALRETGFVDVGGEADLSILPSIGEPGQVILSGLVIMADWIASNEGYFPLMPLDEQVLVNKMERLKTGIMNWYKNNPAESLDVISVPSANMYYQKRFSFLPRPFQQKVFDVLRSTDNLGLLILEAPMGGGKTEAALAAAEELMDKKKLDGLFFGLPTQATSNGIFPRINTWLKNLMEEYDTVGTIKLMHGKAALNDLQEELIEGVHVDEEFSEGVLTAQWFSGKKTSILSDAVVGTVDHFLLAALKQKHLALRHLGFSRKIVIIDEIHAYDAYMNVFLRRAIQWMGAYGIPVILLSATLPAKTRENLFEAYLLGQEQKRSKQEKEEHKKLFQSRAYPLLTYTDNGKICQSRDFSQEKDRRITVKKLDEANLEETIKLLLANGGVVGIIVNTVSRAQNIFERLAQLFGNDVKLLHSKFIDTDRVAKEKHLMEIIGKGARRPKRGIIIGTQVLEQSLDIDFDVLITDLCPMDLLLQRVGRLHRHDISRPERLSQPLLYIMGESKTLEFEQGSAAIYGDYLLARTQSLLPKGEIFIPRDIPLLVQQVYGGENISWLPGIQEKYEKAQKKYEAVLECKDDEANKQFLLRRPHLKIKPEKWNLIGWLNTEAKCDSEANALAQVRDAEESIEVIALLKCDDGYGFFGKKEDISSQVENYKIAKEIAKCTLKLSEAMARYACGTVAKTIEWLEKYNREQLSCWQQQLWLKGSLGILFENTGDGYTGEFRLGNIVLYYNCNVGLKWCKIGD